MTEPVTPSLRWTRLGILAGGGDLPLELAAAQAETNPFILKLSGFTDRDYSGFETDEVSIGQIGRMGKLLKQAGCDAVCFAGYVTRPDLKSLKMDARGMLMVPKALAAGRKGDDALIRVVVGEFEGQGFKVVGAQDVLAALAPKSEDDALGIPADGHQEDITKASKIARGIGALDIGQAAVVANGLILAVEAQEGTNAMLERVAELPAELRGQSEQRAGVLAKMPKPIQERRVDLPTVGVDTVERCAAAGLAGLVLEAGGGLILNRTGVAEALDRHGMFLTLVEPADE